MARTLKNFRREPPQPIQAAAVFGAGTDMPEGGIRWPSAS